MVLDYKTIGDNIRELRKEKGYSQEEITELINEKYDLNYTRQRLGRIENGEGGNTLTLDLLNALSEILECDAGYLLGEIKEKSYDIKNICEITALSEAAITKIISWNNGGVSNITNSKMWALYLSDIITHEKFNSIMDTVTDSIGTSKKWYKIACKIAAGDTSTDTSTFEEETHDRYISKLWYLSKEFPNIIESICDDTMHK